MGILFSAFDFDDQENTPDPHEKTDYTPPPSNFPFPVEKRERFNAIFSIGYNYFETRAQGPTILYQAAKSADMVVFPRSPSPAASVSFSYHAASEIISIPLQPQTFVQNSDIPNLLLEKSKINSLTIRPMLTNQRFNSKRHAEYFKFYYLLPADFIPKSCDKVTILNKISDRFPSSYSSFTISEPFLIENQPFVKWTLQGNLSRVSQLLNMITLCLRRMNLDREDGQIILPSSGAILMKIGYPNFMNNIAHDDNETMYNPNKDVEFSQFEQESHKWAKEILYPAIASYFKESDILEPLYKELGIHE